MTTIDQLGNHINITVARRLTAVFQAFLVLVVMSVVIFSQSTSLKAAVLTHRSLTLGSAKVSALTTHTIGFTINSAATVGSIVFEYCENSPLRQFTCDPSPTLDASAATLNVQSGEVGFSVGSATANVVTLTRIPAASSPGNVSYTLGNIKNPSLPETIFVRIGLYSSVDGSGSFTDDSSLAFATTNLLETSAYVPPYLTFCSGITVALDCTSTNGFNIHLGALAVSQTASATSQFSGATNYTGGYTTYVSGPTMTAGNEVIAPLLVQSPSITGVAQFGLNVRLNSSPGVGNEPDGAGSSVAAAGYGDPNLYLFHSGDALTSTNQPTDYKRFTVSYIVNVPASQAPGNYSSTVTYLAIPSY